MKLSTSRTCLVAAGSLRDVRKLCSEGHLPQALEVVQRAEQQGLPLSIGTLYHLIRSCIDRRDVTAGRTVQGLIHKHGYGSNPFLCTHLIRMLSMSGNLADADLAFGRIPDPDAFAWNAIISAHADLGRTAQAMALYRQMLLQGVWPSEHIFVTMLKACSRTNALREGMLIHAHLTENSCNSNDYISGMLIDMYCKCGSLDNGFEVFNRLPRKDVVVWATVIAGYVNHGCGAEALHLFKQMYQKGIELDSFMHVSILKACSDLKNLDQGKVIHCHIVMYGTESDGFIGSILIDMYNACGCLQDARCVFDKLAIIDVVTWSAMIAGYALHGPGEEALCLFWRMGLGGIEPNNVTFVNLLKACCNIGALICGKLIHSYIIESGCELDVQVGSTLIDMYAKCGTLHDAQILFNNLEERSAVTWNSIIAGYAEYGDYGMMMQSLKGMREGGWKPTIVTFVNLLSACSHLGLGNEASYHFKSLVKDLDIPPIIEHYNCMVDLFGRLGCLKEAEDILKTLPLEANCVGWSSLLSHCKRHGNIELGKECFNHLVTLNTQYTSGYVLMNDIFSSASMWEEASSLHEVKECASAWKKPGKAFIEVDNKVCNFVVGDETHSQWDAISLKLEKLDASVKANGYIPFVDPALQPFCGNASNTELCWEILS